MLDLFTIFSKGGIVLWCFQGTTNSLTQSVNALIKSVVLPEKGGVDFTHEALTLKYRLDNEFELIFVVAYQKILQLSYVDKFLSDIQMEFRNKYKDDLKQGKISRNFDDFDGDFQQMLKNAENEARKEAKIPKQMRTFEESAKSQKTIASMIESGREEKTSKKKAKAAAKEKATSMSKVKSAPSMTNGHNAPSNEQNAPSNGSMDEETIIKNRQEFFQKKMMGGKKKKNEEKSPEVRKKGKEARVWENGGSSRDTKYLNYCDESAPPPVSADIEILQEEQDLVGQMKGALRDMETESSSDEEGEEEIVIKANNKKNNTAQQKSGGWFAGLKSLVGSKTLSQEDIKPVMDKMRDHLIFKNVAAEIADKLCQSVATKLEGKVLGTFNTVASTVKSSLHESCMQILRPHRRVDILRDAMAAREARRPYVITFCGVNGVGKSTNLAKVCFWLVENGFRVLIAACDTFRAGAVEQLRTHTRKLNALHPAEKHNGAQMVQLYEQGYGKDAASIAMQAINFARDMKIDIVLVDTAGRMQDNEPLMRALSKLIKVNQPDLVLFVGEALVGNEAVDQLTKFNQALADHSSMDDPRLIDGILLTKFDTIDDKVGAAISMTYTTGQPIVFVGTGQTYTDLRNLNAKAVVQALLK